MVFSSAITGICWSTCREQITLEKRIVETGSGNAYENLKIEEAIRVVDFVHLTHIILIYSESRSTYITARCINLLMNFNFKFISLIEKNIRIIKIYFTNWSSDRLLGRIISFINLQIKYFIKG